MVERRRPFAPNALTARRQRPGSGADGRKAHRAQDAADERGPAQWEAPARRWTPPSKGGPLGQASDGLVAGPAARPMPRGGTRGVQTPSSPRPTPLKNFPPRSTEAPAAAVGGENRTRRPWATVRPTLVGQQLGARGQPRKPRRSGQEERMGATGSTSDTYKGVSQGATQQVERARGPMPVRGALW